MEPDGRAGIIEGCAVLCWCVSVGLVAGGPTQCPFFLCPHSSRVGTALRDRAPPACLPARWWWWPSSDGDGRTGGGGSPCLVGLGPGQRPLGVLSHYARARVSAHADCDHADGDLIPLFIADCGGLIPCCTYFRTRKFPGGLARTIPCSKKIISSINRNLQFSTRPSGYLAVDLFIYL